MENKSDKIYRSVSIVIPALNEETVIGHCLTSIKRLNTENLCYEIIVVDNGSDDHTVQISESYGARVFIKRGGTISSLRNHGANASTANVLAFLDADCIVPNDWLEKSLYYLNENDSMILGFRLSIPDGSNWVARCWDLLFVKRYSAGERDWIPTGNMVMNRKTFKSIGGFNETLETNEDIDFCLRAKKLGFKIISCGDPSVIHLRPPESLIKIFKKELWHGKEVFREFLKDISENKHINISKGRNFKVVVVSSFYFFCALFLVFAFGLSLNNKTLLPVLIGLLFPTLASFFLALGYVRRRREYNLLFGMTALLLTYGFSRALSLIPLSNFKKIFKTCVKR